MYFKRIEQLQSFVSDSKMGLTQGGVHLVYAKWCIGSQKIRSFIYFFLLLFFNWVSEQAYAHIDYSRSSKVNNQANLQKPQCLDILPSRPHEVQVL